MTRQQAKEVLVLLRPGAPEEQEPEVQQALELVSHDSELARWFEQQRAFQRALVNGFKQIQVPEGLQEQILSERKAHFTLQVRRRAVLLATAVALLLALAGLARLWLGSHQDEAFANFHDRMARKILREYPRMDLETNDLQQIRLFLTGKGAIGDYTMPDALAKANGTGCAALTWHGKRVSMVCLNSGTNDLFLFVIDRSSVANPPPAKQPQLTQINTLTTASWSDADKSYVLATFGGEEFLRKYF